MGPAGSNREVALARDAGLELVIADGEIPEGVRVHLKLDTGMGRYGLSELPSPSAEVVGLMTHLATADSDAAFVRAQLERFSAATEQYSHLTRHAANSAAALRLPESHFDAARCGIAMYGCRGQQRPTRRTGSSPSCGSRRSRSEAARPGTEQRFGRRFVAKVH